METKLPFTDRLERLLQTLPAPEEGQNDESVETTLEMLGIDPAEVDERFKERLEREVAERRGRGEEVPQTILDALANPPSGVLSGRDLFFEPVAWIDHLIEGIPAAPSHRVSLRSLKGETLSDEDSAILESLEAELRVAL